MIYIATGGTGGHVFPAKALAEGLVTRGEEVAFMTDERGQRFLGEKGIILPYAPLKTLKGIIRFFQSFFKVLFLFLKKRPRCVVGFGGYGGFMPVFVAGLLGIPTVIHQADALLGRSNRILSFFAPYVCLSFRSTKAVPKWARTVITGLPLRSIFYRPFKELQSPEGRFNLLILGGSLGANVFGRLIPDAIKLLPESLQEKLSVVQQCRNLEEVRQRYAGTKAHLTLAPFFEDVAERIEDAHLIISRSGASAVMEYSLVGRPAFLVPYPLAMDDHQRVNAEAFVAANYGWMSKEEEITAKKLADFLQHVINDYGSVLSKIAEAVPLADKNAVQKMIEIVERAAKK